MLYRTKRKKSASWIVWRAADLMIGALGLFSLYLGVTGIWTGEIEIFSKRISGTVSWSEDPLFYCGMVVAWFSGGIFMLRIAISDWRGE